MLLLPRHVQSAPLPVTLSYILLHRLYFGESNVEGMLETLLPLHEEMHKTGPTTLQEIAFVQVCQQ